MSSRTPADRLGEYIHVLRGFGCDRRTIVAAHGGLPEGDRLHDRLSGELATTDPESLYDSLHSALSAAPHGLAVERDADFGTVQESLVEVLGAYGGSLSVDYAGASPTVSVTDADGVTRTTTVERPDTTSAPALLGTIASDLLGDVGYRFALLTPREGEWRAVLVEERRLTDLQRRFGVRIEVFGDLLLCRDQPADFVDGTATTRVEAAPDGSQGKSDTETQARDLYASAVSERPPDVPDERTDTGDATAATVVATETDDPLDPESVTVTDDFREERGVDATDPDPDALLSTAGDGSAPTDTENGDPPECDRLAVGDAEAIEAVLASSFDADVPEGTTFFEPDDCPELTLDLVSDETSRN